MTTRARAYLIIGGLRHLLIGAFTLRFQTQYASAAYIPIVGAFPLWAWAGAMLAAAVLMGTAAVLRSCGIARVGLVISASVTLAIGVGITAGIIGVWASGGKATPISAILLLALACKDFAVCAQPIRSPFEPILRRLPPPPGRGPV
jgi:hypothetical protein